MQTRFKKNINFAIIALLLLGCAACQLPDVEVRPAQITGYEVAIKDLPAGWKFKGEDWGQDFGGQSHLVAYGVDDDKIVRLTHTISIYPDEEQAKTAYPQWEDEWFKGSWQKWPEAKFTPSDSKDQYRFECLQAPFDKSLTSCNYLQRHERLISFVLVNFRENVMTFTQFNDILKAVDERLNKIELK
jgi:hypothetical protein